MKHRNDLGLWLGFSVLVATGTIVPASASRASGQATPTPTPALAQNIAALENKLTTLRWVAYAPTNFNPTLGCPNGFPSESSMRADLELLRAAGFSGVITFAADCNLGQIPRLAREAGFDGVIMGLFLFNTTLADEEVANAIAAAADVDGYGVGNEGLIGCGGSFYDQQALTARTTQLRNATDKPVTTSEQIEDYLDPTACLDGWLRTFGDWVFPITHPFNNGIRAPGDGVTFTEGRFSALTAATTSLVFFKETGWPTGPQNEAGATEANQAAYFTQLAGGPARFAYFEAFDGPWKTGSAWEPLWGLFRSDRSAKASIAPALTPSPTPSATPHGVSGTIRYYSNAAPVSGAAAHLQGPGPAVTQTDTSGTFAFPVLGTHNWAVNPTKDGGAGQAITTLDVVHIIQVVTGLRTFTPAQHLACDVTGNGTLTVLDAVRIIQLQTGLLSRFPVAETCDSDWAFIPNPAPAANQVVTDPVMTTGTCQPGAIAWQPLAGQADAQDFAAVLFGDCTGNWQPEN